MTEPRRFLLQYKVPTPAVDLKTAARQASLYAQAAFQSYEQCQPVPLGDNWVIPELSSWWRRYYGGRPIFVNKLRAKDSQIVYLSDMIRPETVEAMARPVRQPVWPSMRAVYRRVCRCGRVSCICPPWRMR